MSSAPCVESATLAAVADEWERLAERVGAAPFLRPGWFEAWWRAFGAGRLEVRLVRAADGTLRALVPLRVGGDALESPSNWHTPEFGFLASDEAAARALLESLFERRPRRVSLGFLAPPQAAALEAAGRARGYRILRRTMQRSPYVPLEGGLEEYERFLGRKVRSELRRRMKLLSERGSVTFEVGTGEDLSRRLEEGLAIEGSGWKDERGTSIQSQGRLREFYAAIARWSSERGWLRLAFLRLDGRALAFDLALQHGGRHYLVKTGYDPGVRELGPGKLLRHEMLRRAFAELDGSYEFLGADDAWKREWAPHARERERVQAFRPSLLGTLDWSLFAHGRPLVKRARALLRARD